MSEEMTTGDVIIGVLAGLGVLVLIVVFIWVFRSVILKSRDE